MARYPYDSENFRAGTSNIVLKKIFSLIHELMFLYEPFGQAASTYEDTGRPEYTALGIRAFLSVQENIGMLEEIGEAVFNSLVTMGIVYTTQGTDAEKKEWNRIMSEMKKADRRTYDAILDSIKRKAKKRNEQ